MDLIYLPSVFKCTEPVKVSEHFEKFSSHLKDFSSKIGVEDENRDLEDDVFELMGIQLTEEQKIDLIQTASPENLKIEFEMPTFEASLCLEHPSNYNAIEIPPEAKSHATIQAIESRLMIQATECRSNNKYMHFLKYRSEMKIEQKTSIESDLSEENEILFHVRFYYPYRYSTGLRMAHIPRFSHEIVLLGSNTVADLKDMIMCSSDVGNALDVSKNPKDVPPKKKCSSGFVYIEGVFYNDFRDRTNEDYSKVIFDWSINNTVGPFTTASLDKTRLKDLKVRLGYPQVYQHEGSCEHLFVFSDVKLLHKKDTSFSENYPMYCSLSIYCTKKCMICGSITARWIVTNCKRLLSEPTYLCDTCFNSYLYKDGEKIGTFRAYAYYDKSSIM